MKFRSAAILATAMASALCLNSAQAAGTASASVSIVEIVLTDLDLTDGITPSLQLLAPSRTASRANATYLNATPRAWIGENKGSSDYFGSLNAQTSVPNQVFGTASKSGDSLETLAVSTSMSAGNSSILRTEADAMSFVEFLLSPNTSLSITFDMSVSADSVTGQSRDAMAYTSAYIDYIWAPRPIGPSFNKTYQEDEFGQHGQAGSVRWTGTIDSGASEEHLFMTINAISSVTPAPVPEPATYGMMLAGLALVGAAGRRARKQRAA